MYTILQKKGLIKQQKKPTGELSELLTKSLNQGQDQTTAVNSQRSHVEKSNFTTDELFSMLYCYKKVKTTYIPREKKESFNVKAEYTKTYTEWLKNNIVKDSNETILVRETCFAYGEYLASMVLKTPKLVASRCIGWLFLLKEIHGLVKATLSEPERYRRPVSMFCYLDLVNPKDDQMTETRQDYIERSCKEVAKFTGMKFYPPVKGQEISKYIAIYQLEYSKVFDKYKKSGSEKYVFTKAKKGGKKPPVSSSQFTISQKDEEDSKSDDE